MPANTTNPKLVARWVTEPEDVAQEVRLALIKHNDNVTHAAAELGVTRATLYNWMRERPELFPQRRTADDKHAVMVAHERQREDYSRGRRR